MEDLDTKVEKIYKERGCTQRCWRVFHMTGGFHKTNCYLHEANLLNRIEVLEAKNKALADYFNEVNTRAQILADHMSEVKALANGDSTNTLSGIVEHCLSTLAAARGE